jgi:Ca-activated chloride channel family protein
LYNEGTAAYQKGEFESSAVTLQDSLKSADLGLQQLGYYNLGNALYRKGQQSQQKDPKLTIADWEKSIKAYQDSLALKPDDEDARFNKELVEKKLAALKQQQPQDQKDEQEKKDQEKKEEEKKEQEKKEQDQQQKDQDKKDEKGEKGDQPKDQPKSGEEKDDKKAEEDSKEKGEEGKEKSEEQKQQEAQQGKDEKGDPKDQKQGEAQQAQQVQMTEEEAKQLLDSLRQEQRFVIPQQKNTGKQDNTTRGKTW